MLSTTNVVDGDADGERISGGISWSDPIESLALIRLSKERGVTQCSSATIFSSSLPRISKGLCSGSRALCDD